MTQILAVHTRQKSNPLTGETWGCDLDPFGGGALVKVLQVKSGWVQYAYIHGNRLGEPRSERTNSFIESLRFVRG